MRVSLFVKILPIYFLLVPTNTLAQENIDSDLLKITVTGTRSEKNIFEYPGSVDVIDKIDLDNKPAVNIRNLFRDIPGVTTTFTTRSGVRGTPGITDVNIRGLDGDQILFLLDGIRLPERYEYGGYYTISKANYVDFSTLKSVEIVKGSASSLYGSDAVGGLIAYTSLTPDDILEENSNFNIEIPVNYTTENNGFVFSIKPAVRITKDISTLFIYTHEQSSESKVLTQPKYLNPAANSGNNYFLNTQYDLNESSKLNLIYENVSRKSRIDTTDANLELLSSKFRNWDFLISNTNVNRERLSISYSYEGTTNTVVDTAKIIAYAQKSKAEDNFSRDISTENKVYISEDKQYNLITDMVGVNAALVSTFSISGTDHNLGYGFDISKSDGSRTRETYCLLEEGYCSRFPDHAAGTVKRERDTPNTTVYRSGIYLQDQFSISGLDLIAGIRYDKYVLDAQNDSIYNISQNSDIPAADQSYEVLSPSLSIAYSPTDSISLYARYSQGFRPPAWYEVNSSFSNPLEGYKTIANPDLQPETSNDFEIGLKLNTDQFDFSFATYYNMYSDLIQAFTPLGIIDGITVYQTRNISDADIYGVELASKYYFNSNREGFYISNVLSWMEGNDLSLQTPLETIVPFTNRLSIGYTGYLDLWSVTAGLTYSGAPRLSETYEYFIPPQYLISDITANFQINDSLSINASINNLTNQRYYNFQDVRGRSAIAPDISKYSYPERNYQIGVRMTF